MLWIIFITLFLQEFPSGCRMFLKWKKKIQIAKLQICAGKYYYFCAARKLQNCAKFITNWRGYYKLAQKVLQICAAITNLRNYYKSAHNSYEPEFLTSDRVGIIGVDMQNFRSATYLVCSFYRPECEICKNWILSDWLNNFNWNSNLIHVFILGNEKCLKKFGLVTFWYSLDRSVKYTITSHRNKGTT